MKIDITKIDGFDKMTAEEKLSALTNYEIEAETPDYTGWVRKEVLDKKASEASELSKKLKEKMSEAEQAEAERAAKEKEKDDLLQSLIKDKTVSESKAKFLALGYDEELATEAATALADNDNGKLFEAQKKFTEAYSAKVKTDLLKDTPRPDNNSGNPTQEQLNAMSDAEYYKTINTTKKE